MNILVVGLGSMGKRRIRLIKQIDESIKLYGVDSREDRRKQAEELYGIVTFNDLDVALKNEIDAAFICTSPLSHANLIETCLGRKLHVFTEINLFSDGYEKNMKLAKEQGVVLFLSSTFCYREEIKYIIDAVAASNSQTIYTYHVGQYLPDWHPWENYTDYFIGDSKTNGCREIMAIEFPWIIKAFGKVLDIQIKKGKKSNLKIGYNDTYSMLLAHESGTQGVITVDVVSRKAVRNLEVFSEDLYISWDGSENGLKKYDFESKTEKQVVLYDSVDKQENYAAFIVENEYKNEINAFFDIIKSNGKMKAVYDFSDDLEVLALIDKIES